MSDLGAGDIIIQTAAFSADEVEITWMDPRAQSRLIREWRTSVVDRSVADVEVAEAIDSLRAALERGQIARRDPPDRIER